MRLNISNDPFCDRTLLQKETAIDQYTSIEDISFPKILVAKEDAELSYLVEKYFNRVQEQKPTVIHMMGEIVFTFQLITKLKSLDILCIASISDGIVTEQANGLKTGIFYFVRFRKYSSF